MSTTTNTLQLQLGKRYLARDGKEVLIDGFHTDPKNPYPFEGVHDDMRLSWKPDGTFLDSRPHDADLVSEIRDDTPAYRYFVRRAGCGFGTRLIWRLDPQGRRVHCRDLDDPLCDWLVSSHSPRTLLEDDELVESCEDGVLLVPYYDAASAPVQLKTTLDLTAAQRTRIAKLAARITLADGPVLSIDELAGMTVGELVTRLDGVTDIYGI